MDGTGPRPATHPIAFLVLYLPFSMPLGYASVVLGKRLHDAGVGATAIGSLLALMLVVQLAKIIWAPVVDAVFSFKGWYVAAAILAAVAIAAVGVIVPTPASMPALTGFAVLLSAAASFMSVATEGLMAYATPPSERGRTGGWSQAGNLVGSAIGGAGGLLLVTHLQAPASAALALVPLLCIAALALVQEPARQRSAARIGAGLAAVGRDVWASVRTRPALLTLLLFLLPIGCAAAANMVGVLAPDWGVSADLLAAVSGGSGLAALLGAVAGGYICDRLDRGTAYVAFGFVLAGVAVAMALAPHTPWLFVGFALAYMAASGLVQAAFAAVTLETIGLGAAATKFSLFAALNNAPFAYMAVIEGWARARWNSGAMLALEGALGAVSGLGFLLVRSAARSAG